MQTPLIGVINFLAQTAAASASPAGPAAGPTSTALDPVVLLTHLALGVILGSTGQGARAVVGWKKIHDTAVNNGVSVDSLFRARDMVISFLIGSIAGVLASVGLLLSQTPLDGRSIMTIIGAGYAGADFIEGFATQWLRRKDDDPGDAGPDTPTQPKPSPAATGAAGNNAAGLPGMPPAVPAATAAVPDDRDDPNAPAARSENLAVG